MSAAAALLQAIREVVRPGLAPEQSPIELFEASKKSDCRPIILRKTGPAVVVKTDLAGT